MNFAACQGGAMPCHETRREESDFRFRVILREIGGRDLPVVQPKPVFSGPRQHPGQCLQDLYGPFNRGMK